jgi:hypothetical protein
MAQKVEEWMKRVARSEALACQWHLTGQDVSPVLGQIAGRMWDALVSSADPERIMFELEYRIEAGSARKPNVEGQIKRMDMAMQQMAQMMWQYAQQTGNVAPMNALLTDWAKANDVDPASYLLPTPPPPPPQPQQGPPQGGPPSRNGAAKPQAETVP